MALCGSSVSSQRFEAVSVKWGREHCRSVEFVADVAGSLTDEYFDVNVLDEDQVETAYYVLLSGTTPAVDPAPVGKTKIDVTYTDGDDAATIAGLFVTALAAINVTVEQTLGVVEMQNKDLGEVTVEVNTNAPSLTFAIGVVGIGGDLGVTESGIELSIETTTTELKANQTGEQILGEIQTGVTASVSANLLEMTLKRWEIIVGGVTGDIFTPAAGTRLVGGGRSRNFSNLFNVGGKLILHPISLPKADKSFDVVFWKSAPKPSSVTYSGTEPQMMAVEFVAYDDTSKPAEISLYAQGDYTQDLV